MQRVYRWHPSEGVGLEHLILRVMGDVIVAEAVVIGDRGDGPFGCTYRICCDACWRVRSVDVHAAGGESRVLTTDGSGTWRDGDGAALPALDGCLDVDISATPFTNTLPIRRLGARLRQRTPIRVVYIPVPELDLHCAEQAYTWLAPERYLYEGPIGAFEAELEVDPNGVVVHYPALFHRLPGA
ncbi:putative glycolipid-binding domain-containing protein [Massilia consociata]|uniref:Glycolipid-binding domain-containing protein n=1 Tax=Massilia consociata TaxID=760117 RepID=A0ABV6FEH6_9BURK